MSQKNEKEHHRPELSGLKVWERNFEDAKKALKGYVAPCATDDEIRLFIQIGKSSGANPFLREIFMRKYGDNPATIFLGRDFYRRRAQEQADYNGHTADSVYTNDHFEVENGIPKHSYGIKDRGQLVGAYCVVYRNGLSHPYFRFVFYREYYEGAYKPDGTQKMRRVNGEWVPMKANTWDSKPDTMIVKVAEAQGLRGGYQGVFAGTYSEGEEFPEIGPGETREVDINEPPTPPVVPEQADPAALKIGDCIPKEFWRMTKAQKKAMLPAGTWAVKDEQNIWRVALS